MSVDAGTSPGDDRVSAFPVTVPLFKPGFRRMNDPRYAVGFMTGTSVDGIDAAVIEARGYGTTLSARVVDHVQEPLGELRPELLAFARGEPMAAAEIASLSRRFGELHARRAGPVRGGRSLPRPRRRARPDRDARPARLPATARSHGRSSGPNRPAPSYTTFAEPTSPAVAPAPRSPRGRMRCSSAIIEWGPARSPSSTSGAS